MQVLQNILRFFLDNIQILIVVGIFGISILSAIAKRLKEQADRRQIAHRREQAAREALRTGRVSAGTAATSAPGPNTQQRRLAEVAARRQAQLDELRRRRAAAQQAQQQARQQAKQAGQRGPQLSPQRAAQPPARVQPPARPAQPAPRPSARTPQPPAGPSRTFPQARPMPVRPGDERVPSLSPPHPEHDDGVVHSLVASRAAPTDLSRPAAPLRVTSARRDIPHGHALVGDLDALRRAVILAEVLGPPVSMRDPAER